MYPFRMITNIAVADAYSAAFNGVEPVDFKNDLKRYYTNPKYNTRPGHYTDGTQMAMAVGEHILACSPWTEAWLSYQFLKSRHSDDYKRIGFRDTHVTLNKTRIPEGFLKIVDTNNDGADAAIRAGVIGLYPDEQLVIDYAKINARATNNTPIGISSSIASALMVHYFAYDIGSHFELADYLNEHISVKCTNEWSGAIGSSGMDAVSAAVSAISESKSLSETIHRCIAYKGNVNAASIIATGALSNCNHLEQNIPKRLYLALESGTYGRPHITYMNKRLLTKCDYFEVKPWYLK